MARAHGQRGAIRVWLLHARQRPSASGTWTLGALSLDKDSDVARARLAFERVLSDALGPAESLALVQRLAGL
jgi:hypothetical protein